MAFRFDKLTIKAQEAVPARKSWPPTGQSSDRAAALVGGALEARQTASCGPMLEKIGANVNQLESIVEAELKHLPRSSGGSPPSLSSQLSKVLEAAQPKRTA